MKLKEPKEIILRKIIPLISALLIIILIILSYFHYKSEKYEVLVTEYNELAFSTHLKTDRLTTWMNQYISNAESYSFSPLLANALDLYFKTHSVEVKGIIIKRLQIIRKFKKNETVIISDTFGNIRISLDEQENKLDSISIHQLKKTLILKHAVLSEIHQCPISNKLYLDIMSPVIDESEKVIGIMIIRMDPLKELIPRYKNDRTYRTQEQSFLISRLGSRLFILKDSTFSPLIDKSISEAILHHADQFNGTDGNQNKTIAYIEPVKNTNWYLITKISYNNAIKKYNPYAKTILLINGIIVFFLLISIAFLFRYRQKNIYKSLLRSEFAFKQTFLTIPDAVLINRIQDEIYIEVNESFTSLSGFKKEEVIGKTALDINIWDDPEDRKKFFSFLTALGYCENFETRFRRKDGTLFTATISGRNINLHGVGHIISIVHDITGRKKMEDELLKAKNKAEESDRLKTSFLHNISHEIRTPMNGIVGFADLLKNKNLTDKNKSEYVDIINKSANQLLSIVDDILQISKIESGSVLIQTTTFDVNEIMKKVYHLFLPKVNVNFSYNCALNECFIESDKEKIKQILSALVDNAIKFTSTGEIVFAYKISESFLEFSVQDTGIGVPAKEQTKIFERFYQIDNEQTRKHGGNGLGLNIAKNLVELLNGRIWLDTEYKKGCRFCFSIPYADSESLAQIEKNMNYDFRNLTILVAEDVQTNLDFLKILLTMKGADVISATNGTEVITSVRQNKIDLILMDLKMPGMDGLEATRLIKKSFPEIPIIAQTAYSLPEEKEQALAAGCTSFVSKPIRADALYFEIRQIVNRK